MIGFWIENDISNKRDILQIQTRE